MNYRHAFHAGNFADLVKHAALLVLMDRLRERPGPIRIVDTHAGRGVYDVSDADAARSGEAKEGVFRLGVAENVPLGLEILKAAMRRLNPGGGVRTYPGSPELIAGRLRPGDRYLACELRPEEHSALAQNMQGRPGVKTACVDGFARAASLGPEPGQTLVLIDPPFERADDYSRIVETVRTAGARLLDAQFLIWLPLKDLETLDSFLRLVEDADLGPVLVAEARMRSLLDPMKMNGCALVLVRPVDGVEAPLTSIVEWVVEALGDGGEARLWWL